MMNRTFSILIVLSLVIVPLSAMAQQTSGTFPDGKDLSPSDSLAVTTPKVSGNVSIPAVAAPGYDPIGNEEEMDAEDGFDYQEWLLMWPEQDEDREYDPMDPREDGQEADTRE